MWRDVSSLQVSGFIETQWSWPERYIAFHMCVQGCDTTDNWLLTSGARFKIKTSGWRLALLYFYTRRQLSVIGCQALLF